MRARGHSLLVPVLLQALLAAETPEPVRDLAASETAIHALLDAGQWRAALDRASALAREIPDEPRARTLVAESLFRAGRFAEVEPLLAELERSPAAPARALMTLARLRDAQGREADAVSLMRRAVAAAPDDRDVLYQAASATESRGEAVELLERYLARSAGDDEETILAARGQVRLYAALGERPVWTATERPAELDLALEPLWVPETGQVVGRVIEVRLGEKGRRVKLLLDSGSPGLFVIERIARKAGFAPLTELEVFGGGGTGRHTTGRGFFATCAIGSLSFADALASAARQELDSQGRYHGLLGLAVFNGYRITLDLAEGRLRAALPTSPLVDGAPYYTVGGQMLVEATTSAGEGGLFLLDTGSTSTLVAQALVERLAGAEVGAAIDLPAYGGSRRAARELRGVEVRFQGLTTGARTLRAVDLALRSQVGGVEIAGFLGLDLLDGTRIEIDTASRTVAIRDGPPGARGTGGGS